MFVVPRASLVFFLKGHIIDDNMDDFGEIGSEKRILVLGF
jgi:hypothetical protein